MALPSPPPRRWGIRQDGGDAETGFGTDIRAGVLWISPEHGISGELKGRTLLIHAAEDFRDQGLALSFSWDPTPSSNRGPALSVGHSLGASVDGDLDVFLGPSWEGEFYCPPVLLHLPGFPEAGSSGRIRTRG